MGGLGGGGGVERWKVEGSEKGEAVTSRVTNVGAPDWDTRFFKPYPRNTTAQAWATTTATQQCRRTLTRW